MNKLTVKTGKLQAIRHSLAGKLQKYRAAKKQRGMTLLEIIIVLGIIGVIAAGVVILAQRAYDSKALADIKTNTATVRVSIKDAVGSIDGVYYPGIGDTKTLYNNLTDATFTTVNASGEGAHPERTTAILSRVASLGKISGTEAKNTISNEFYFVAGVPISADNNTMKGFILAITGLNQSQCRNLLGIGNDWDYVEVATGASYSNIDDGIQLSTAVTATIPNTGLAVLRSLTNPVRIDGAKMGQACGNNSQNIIILGSR